MLRHGMEPSAHHCLAGAFDLVNGRRVQDRLVEVVLGTESVSSEDILRKSLFKGSSV